MINLFIRLGFPKILGLKFLIEFKSLVTYLPIQPTWSVLEISIGWSVMIPSLLVLLFHRSSCCISSDSDPWYSIAQSVSCRLYPLAIQFRDHWSSRIYILGYSTFCIFIDWIFHFLRKLFDTVGNSCSSCFFLFQRQSWII